MNLETKRWENVVDMGKDARMSSFPKRDGDKRGIDYRRRLAGLCSAAEVFYPEVAKVCYFAAQDCLSLDDISYIGAYAKETKDLLICCNKLSEVENGPLL